MKVAVVTGVCVRFDAVSDSVRQNVDALRSRGDEVTLFSYSCEYDDIPHIDVGDPTQVVHHPTFQDADLIVFHFAIYYPLFHALIAAPRRAKIIVVFHNVTPKDLLPSWKHKEIDESFRQLSLLSFVDHVACDSEYNEVVLREHGILTPATSIGVGMSLNTRPPESKPSATDGVFRIAYIGRFVRSKGPIDLLKAIASALPDIPQDEIRLDLIGSPRFSDPEILLNVQDEVRRLNARHGRRLRSELHLDASDADKAAVLRRADLFALPTYHEGFCVPVVEAFASGCRIAVYDNSNTPFITGGTAELVPTGDVPAFARALVEIATEVASASWFEAGGGYETYRELASGLAAHHDLTRSDARFLGVVDEVMGRRRLMAASTL